MVNAVHATLLKLHLLLQNEYGRMYDTGSWVQYPATMFHSPLSELLRVFIYRPCYPLTLLDLNISLSLSRDCLCSPFDQQQLKFSHLRADNGSV